MSLALSSRESTGVPFCRSPLWLWPLSSWHGDTACGGGVARSIRSAAWVLDSINIARQIAVSCSLCLSRRDRPKSDCGVNAVAVEGALPETCSEEPKNFEGRFYLRSIERGTILSGYVENERRE